MSYSEFIEILQTGNSVFTEIKGYGAYITVRNNEIVCEIPELEWSLSFNGSKFEVVYKELYVDCSQNFGLVA